MVKYNMIMIKNTDDGLSILCTFLHNQFKNCNRLDTKKFLFL